MQESGLTCSNAFENADSTFPPKSLGNLGSCGKLEAPRKGEVSPQKARVVLKIDSPGVLAPAIYYFCWLEKGGEQVELKSILLWKAEEVKMSISV